MSSTAEYSPRYIVGAYGSCPRQFTAGIGERLDECDPNGEKCADDAPRTTYSVTDPAMISLSPKKRINGPSAIGRFFSCLSLVFFGTVLFLLLISHSSAGASVAAVIAVFCAMMAFPDRFEFIKFSASGFEAKAREAIRQVEVTLAQLQSLAIVLSRVNLDQIVFSGQIFVGMSTSHKFALRDGIVEQLRAIGVDDRGIEDAQAGWIEMYCLILKDQVLAIVEKHQPNQGAAEQIAALQTDTKNVPLPDELAKWVSSKAIDEPALNELIAEYKTLWATGSMRHPDIIPFGSHPRLASR